MKKWRAQLLWYADTRGYVLVVGEPYDWARHGL